MSAAGRDPKGYYQVLGLPPSADAAAIRSAFRARAKSLHPDRNPDAGAVAAFQRANEAYRVLRDPLQRLCYEAFGELLPPPEDARPQACRVCGGMSAQPRFIVFEMVKSCLVGSKRHTISGIFCPACAKRTALRASIVTWAAGWWSPSGLVAAPLVLLRNLFGGIKPRAQNFNLLLHQARAFAARGEHEVAAALAAQARVFASGGVDGERLAGFGGGRRLRDRWGMLHYAFFAQLLPFAVAALAAISLTGAEALVADTWRRSEIAVSRPAPMADDPAVPRTGRPSRLD